MDARKSLQALLDLTRSLAGTQEMDAALQAITDASLMMLPGDHASVRLIDDSGTALLAGARSGIGASKRKITFRPGEGVVGWVAEHGRPARIDDTEADERFAAKPDQGFAVRSLLVVPLLSADAVVGVLGVSASRKSAFTADHELLARLLANCAVPPIERARLELMSVTDERTNAFNARFLMPRLREEIIRARLDRTDLSLMMLDLDRFKDVNDTWGHQAGDMVLKRFADRVRGTVRRRDILVRRGGDEFVLIMPASDPAAALHAAQRLQQSLRDDPLGPAEAPDFVQTVSVGVATWDRHESAESFEVRADYAMYEAKKGGRDRVVVARPGSGSAAQDGPEGEPPAEG